MSGAGPQARPLRRSPAVRAPTPGAAGDVARREPLARYVPIEASLYFRMSDDTRWQQLAGPTPRGAGRLSALLKGQPRVVALPTWRNRKEMITLCAPSDPTAFTAELMTPPAEVVRQEPPVKVYRLSSGVWVATDGRVFVLSDIGLGSAIFEWSVKILAGEKHQSLLEDDRFQRYARRADPRAQGLLFLDEPWSRRRGQGDRYQAYRPRWVPDLESGYLEIHLEEQQVRCELRSQRRNIHSMPTRAIAADHTRLIPANAVAIWMGPLDVLSILEFAAQYLPKAEPSFYRQLARTLVDSNLSGILPLSQIGPRSTWCLLSSPHQDQLPWAVFLEAKQAAAGARSLAQICQGVTSIINARPTSGGPEASFQTSDYKNHAIHELTLIRESGGETFWGLFRELHPSFSAVGGQLVLASDAAVIRNVIDAYENPQHKLPVLAEWTTAAQSESDVTQIRGFLNPQSLARQLRPIQSILQDHDSELLQSPWFQSFKEYFQDTPVQLGARLRRDNAATPGKVYVMHVLEGRPADGKLAAGDYIVGIDGQALELDDPIDDLRSKLLAKPGGGQRLLRVERRGQLREVAIHLPRASDKSVVGLLDDTGRAIEHLGRLGAVVDKVTYRQFGSDISQLNAQIIFKLKTATAK